MNLARKSVLIALAAAIPLGAALADSHTTKPAPAEMSPRGKLMIKMFDEADADKNGTLTQKELHGYRLGRFKSADGNDDGTLSADELDAMLAPFRAERMRRMLVRMDTDGNGKVDAEEFARFRGRWMHHLDPNADGNIEKADMERMMMKEHRGQHGQHHGGHHGNN
jgi:hypothetical protein